MYLGIQMVNVWESATEIPGANGQEVRFCWRCGNQAPESLVLLRMRKRKSDDNNGGKDYGNWS